MNTFFRVEHLRRTVTDSSDRNQADAWPRFAMCTHIFFESGHRPKSGVSLFVSGFYRAGLRAVVRDHIFFFDTVDFVDVSGLHGRGPESTRALRPARYGDANGIGVSRRGVWWGYKPPSPPQTFCLWLAG